MYLYYHFIFIFCREVVEAIKMTAGSIAVPTIVPLRPPIPGKPKTSIDSNTKVELSTGDCMIYMYLSYLLDFI